MSSSTSIAQTLAALQAGAQEIHTVQDLEKKLTRGVPLRIKLGADPTAADLHLGHAVVLSKLRQFQDLGHEVIFLIGDFTARIGDPTGRSKTRPPLSPEDIAEHSKTYLAQVARVLDPTRLTVVYNSTWLAPMGVADWLKVCGKATVARIIERDDFARRLAEHQPVGMHELMYPLLQGYDSVALKADVELGGSDQLFNILMGRFLQEQFGQEPQVCLTVPLLPGLDGVQKMSKSYGNYIGLYEPAGSAYGKLMSISDDLMWTYYEILLHVVPDTIAQWQQDVSTGATHPLTLKKQMAYQVVARFWSPDEATAAQATFERVVQDKQYDEVPEAIIPVPGEQTLLSLVKQLPLDLSATEIRRRIAAGAVSIDGVKIEDPFQMVNPQGGMVIKVGKILIFRLKL